MDAAIERRILDLLDEHRIMTVATLRPDGWPQATTVGYVNEGLAIYFFCASDSQKAGNLAADDRISLTIARDVSDLTAIRGLSMAAHAEQIIDPNAVRRIVQLLPMKFPEHAGMPILAPSPERTLLFRVRPTVISVINYRQGFGHSDLVTV
ncbi:pyridoxamine 5'-phosphate oxidase family protein [Faunimonas sp. B44]|uniref:pyridoxamine 5'-phosphate oxidase family protein n=1 Tax=Faunimonas sp. B44 TaxID=3461493 RepID=UPI004044B26C